jgi:hypothetical protein
MSDVLAAVVKGCRTPALVPIHDGATLRRPRQPASQPMQASTAQRITERHSTAQPSQPGTDLGGASAVAAAACAPPHPGTAAR